MNVTAPGWRGAVLLALAVVGCAQPTGTAPRPTSTLPSPYIPADWPLFADVAETVGVADFVLDDVNTDVAIDRSVVKVVVVNSRACGVEGFGDDEQAVFVKR